jgi:hypothetical protein
MELVLSAISAGGLVGAANQYACLLILSIAARLGWINLSVDMAFMTSYWFIGITGAFWIITLAPAYSSLLAPGVMNVINTISNFLSGFIVPFSSALLSLASVGVISSMNPDLNHIVETLKIFTPDGSIGGTGFAIAGAGAASATVLTAMKAIAKPGISAATGTTATISAPLFATIENIAAIVLMVLAYFLTKVDPWLLVVLAAVILIIFLVLLIFALYQLKRLKKGLGKVLYISQKNPRAGLSIITEFFVWGIGWLVWKYYARGVIMLFFLALWLIVFIIVQPIFVGLFAFFPPAIPFVGFSSIVFLLIIYGGIGLFTSRSLLKILEVEVEKTPAVSPAPANI